MEPLINKPHLAWKKGHSKRDPLNNNSRGEGAITQGRHSWSIIDHEILAYEQNAATTVQRESGSLLEQPPPTIRTGGWVYSSRANMNKSVLVPGNRQTA